MKLLIIPFYFLSICAFASSLSFNTNQVGDIDGINIPLSVKIIKSTCTINGGAGIPNLVNLGNAKINESKRVAVPIKFTDCYNVNSVNFEFSAISSYNFIGNGKISTSNPNINLTLYNENNIISNYKGSVNISHDQGLFPLNIDIIGKSAGSYTSAVNLTIIYT
ncbi:hypothetical protein [Photobacterium lucens]|uniref:hypothetical protein n=1 Tax=Photobacterium lucens TaxID=2562949 RepID=UPI00136F4841|nr:hypothetical protein [Photobacterium lucens]MBP2701004.1 hypothetical protein [Vibrio parahaemolyticus]MZG57465.1 hypothetical protein [Photobacterium lucens]MZG80888.1 hypothetical protein [Photobacterium lucens]